MNNRDILDEWRYQDSFSPEHLVEKAGKHEFEYIRDEAVEDLKGLLEVDSEAVSEIPVETEERGTKSGKIEVNKDRVESLKRDILEETGLKEEVLEINGSYPSADNPEWELVPVHIKSYSRNVELADEHLNYDWIKPEE